MKQANVVNIICGSIANQSFDLTIHASLMKQRENALGQPLPCGALRRKVEFVLDTECALIDLDARKPLVLLAAHRVELAGKDAIPAKLMTFGDMV